MHESFFVIFHLELRQSKFGIILAIFHIKSMQLLWYFLLIYSNISFFVVHTQTSIISSAGVSFWKMRTSNMYT